MALVLEFLSFSDQRLSELVYQLPVYTMIKDKIKQDKNKNLSRLWKKLLKLKLPEKIVQIDRQDGLRIDFKDSWLSVRPSNTEPILRFIAEAKTKNKTQQLVKLAKKCYEKI